MTHSPFFSVIIPTYNRASFIRKTIQSVLVQKFENFEIIVVDDGSKDNTEAVVKDIPDERIRYFRKNNGERAAARNFGVQQAKGIFVNFLDSDDYQYGWHLSTAYTFCESRDTEVFHLGYDMKDEHDNLLRSVTDIYSVKRQILSGNMLSCNGVFIKRMTILENRFNEDRVLSSLEDWELWIRLSARYSFPNSNVVTSTVIQHEERSVMTIDTSAIKSKVDRFVKYVLEDQQNVNVLGTGLRKVVASAWTYAALHILIAKGKRGDAVSYLLKGIRRYPGEILRKRFLVIVSKLFGM